MHGGAIMAAARAVACLAAAVAAAAQPPPQQQRWQPPSTPTLGRGAGQMVPEAQQRDGADAAAADPWCHAVTAYGALGDGAHDDTVAFQRAADAAAASGGCVRVPPARRGGGFVLTSTVTLAAGVKLVGETVGYPEVPHAYGPPGDLNTTGGSRILARVTTPRAPLLSITQGCGVKGLYIIYDRMPYPTDAEFVTPGSPFYYPTFQAARENFRRDHVPAVGPAIFIKNGVRVHVENVIASGYVDFIYFSGAGHGQSSVTSVQGWGYGRFVTVEQASDVLSFSNWRYSVNAGPNPLGQRPPAHACEVQHPQPAVCRGNFTTLPAIVALDSDNVGLWLGRADGYMATDLFFFGVGTAIRLGFAPGNGTALRNPVTGELAGGGTIKPGQSAEPGSLPPGHGPWGSISGLMVDQCVVGIHFVWPNPLSNRFTNTQLHPSFWDGRSAALTNAGSCRSSGMFQSGCPTAGTDLGAVGREAAVLFETTHTVASNSALVPTTMFSNLLVASFNDTRNYGRAGSMLGQSNGRAFLFEGDGGSVVIDGFAMNNERDADSNLWAAREGSQTTMLVRSPVLNYSVVDDFVVQTASPDRGAAQR